MFTSLIADSLWYSQMLQSWQNNLLPFAWHTAPRLAILLLVAGILIRIVGFFTSKLKSLGDDGQLPPGIRAQQLHTAAALLSSLGTFLIIFLALMHAMSLFGMDLKPILASAGVAGLAIGFGAQTLVKDVINGFFILFENQFQVGDVVRIAGVTGTVEVMTLRGTKLRDLDGTVHMIPNSEIHIVSNETRDWTQVTLHVAVDYQENSDRVIQLLEEVGRQFYEDPACNPWLVATPEVLGIERVTGAEVDYLLVAKVKPKKHFAVSRELRRRVKEALEKNNIKAGGPRMFVMDAGRPATPAA